MKYAEYLQSDEWKIKRQLALQQAGGRCRICNDSEKLHVHHRSYKRKGTPEEVLDLVVLCAECHDWFHKKDEVKENIQELEKELSDSEGWECLDYEHTILVAEHIVAMRALAFLGLEEAEWLIARACLQLGISWVELRAFNIFPDLYENTMKAKEEWGESKYEGKLIAKALDYTKETVKEIEKWDLERCVNG